MIKIWSMKIFRINKNYKIVSISKANNVSTRHII